MPNAMPKKTEDEMLRLPLVLELEGKVKGL